MSGYGLRTEYGKLNAVLLFKPGPEIGAHPAPAEIQHLQPIDHAALSCELDRVRRTFSERGIETVLIDPTPLSEDRNYVYNMMYCRDLLFMTPQGAVLANMANGTRTAEVLYAERTLKQRGIPILHTVDGDGRFEGADAIWVHDHLVMIGVGGRTNKEALSQIKPVLRRMNVECIAIPFKQTRTQHLLGAVQLVDRNLALVRSKIADRDVLRLLQEQRITVVDIPESNEVCACQAMNIVTIAPRTIIMADHCPETRQLYVRAGLTIAAELDLRQLLCGAGGLACATGILSRG